MLAEHEWRVPGTAARTLTRLDLDDQRWTDFVTRHRDATPFHLAAWSHAVAECYRLPSFGLAVADGRNRIIAGLPVVEVRRAWGARRWASLPFTDHCPVLADSAADGAALMVAVRAALARERIARIAIRAAVDDEAGTDVAVRHVLPLDTAADTFARFHRSQVQRNIRRAAREGVTVRAATDARDLTEVFYGLHLLTRRRQGVPVQPRRFFSLVWEHVISAGHGSVLVAERRGVPVAAAVFVRHNGTVVYKWGASDAAAWEARPNHALFWHAIRTACQAGDVCFDWGRTDRDNRGLRAFKSSWGASELPLTYTCITANRGSDASTPVGVGASQLSRLGSAVIRNGPAWVCVSVGEALYRFAA